MYETSFDHNEFRTAFLSHDWVSYMSPLISVKGLLCISTKGTSFCLPPGSVVERGLVLRARCSLYDRRAGLARGEKGVDVMRKELEKGEWVVETRGGVIRCRAFSWERAPADCLCGKSCVVACTFALLFYLARRERGRACSTYRSG